MITNSIGMRVYNLKCVQNRKDSDSCAKTISKVSSFVALIEIAACVYAIILAVQILTNSLPANLAFLKGRTGLATAMGITGISLLVLSSSLNNVFAPFYRTHCNNVHHNTLE